MNKAPVLIAVLMASVIPSAVLAQKAKKSSEKTKSSSHTAAVVNKPEAPEVEKKDESATSVVTPEPTSPTNAEPDDSSLTSIYRVGPGDVLDIRLHNFTSGGSTLFTVLEDGAIDFPLLGGPVKVGSLTTAEIEKRLTGEFKRRALLDATAITVNVRQYASHSVIITGLVVSGGTRMLRREAVPLYVVLAESQPRLDAGRAIIMRANKPLLTVDLSDSSSSSVLVKPGDVINVTARPELFYYIAGRVNAPGQKIFQSGITLLQSILAAGGLRNADGVVEISRESGDGILTTTRFSVRDIKAGKQPDPRLQPGDRIEILH